MAGKPMRTPGGAPSQAARDQSGMKGGAFPVFDDKSAMDAIKLRGHSSDPNAVLNHVQAWAAAHNDQAALDAVHNARRADAGGN